MPDLLLGLCLLISAQEEKVFLLVHLEDVIIASVHLLSDCIRFLLTLPEQAHDDHNFALISTDRL